MASRRTVKIVDKDKGFRALVKAAKAANLRLTVGIHGDKGGVPHVAPPPPAGSAASPPAARSLTVAEVGSFHEFGLGDVPQRSFIGGWFDAERATASGYMRKAAARVTEGALTVQRALQLVGLGFVGGMQQRIAAGIAPALSETTIRRKGSSVPLIDTGQLRSSIESRVEQVR
jgi:hypothetical protein